MKNYVKLLQISLAFSIVAYGCQQNKQTSREIIAGFIPADKAHGIIAQYLADSVYLNATKHAATISYLLPAEPIILDDSIAQAIELGKSNNKLAKLLKEHNFDALIRNKGQAIINGKLVQLLEKKELIGHTDAILAPAKRLIPANPLELRLDFDPNEVVAKFAPISKYYVTGSADKTARVWDVEAKKSFILYGHTSGVVQTQFSPDGKTVVTGDRNGLVIYWDFIANQSIVCLAHNKEIATIKFFSNDTFLTSCKNKQHYIWDVKKRRSYAIESSFTKIDFIQKQNAYILFNQTGDMIYVSLHTGHKVLCKGHNKKIDSARFAEDCVLVTRSSADGKELYWAIEEQENNICISGTNELQRTDLMPINNKQGRQIEYAYKNGVPTLPDTVNSDNTSNSSVKKRNVNESPKVSAQELKAQKVKQEIAALRKEAHALYTKWNIKKEDMGFLAGMFELLEEALDLEYKAKLDEINENNPDEQIKKELIKKLEIELKTNKEKLKLDGLQKQLISLKIYAKQKAGVAHEHIKAIKQIQEIEIQLAYTSLHFEAHKINQSNLSPEIKKAKIKEIRDSNKASIAFLVDLQSNMLKQTIAMYCD